MNYKKSKEVAEIPWLQGGPFLEISFLIEYSTTRGKFLNFFFDELKKLPQEHHLRIFQLSEKIDEFVKGYPQGEENTSYQSIHSVKVPLTINVLGKRKSELHISEIAENTVLFTFCFFGGEDYKSTLDQRGIKETDIPPFARFLSSLYGIFRFPFGTIGFEVDCLSLFGYSKVWPDDCYKIKRLDLEVVISDLLNHHFLVILFQESLYHKSMIYPSRKIADGGILIEVFRIKREMEVKFTCPCCGYKTLDEPIGSFDICPVCFWEADTVQSTQPDYGNCPNNVSLRQAQENFIKFGACSKEMIKKTRKPNKNDKRDPNWGLFKKISRD